jgi:hypothetical protein
MNSRISTFRITPPFFQGICLILIANLRYSVRCPQGSIVPISFAHELDDAWITATFAWRAVNAH